MNMKRLMFYCLAGLVAGCIPVVSLHPLFTKDNVVFDEKLLGVWLEDPNNPDASWEFARFDANTAGNLPDELKENMGRLYRLNITDKDGHKGSFVTCLVKLENRLLLDVFADKFPSGEDDAERMKLMYNVLLFLPTHTFIRVDGIGDQLKISLTRDEEFKQLLEAEPQAVTSTEVDDRIVLTGPTKELQAFVLKYADDKRLFPDERTLTRKSK
jgi:hypothetical protein